MTDEQIKTLAQEYAATVAITDDDRAIEYDFALPVVRWLAAHYEFIPRIKPNNEAT